MHSARSYFQQSPPDDNFDEWCDLVISYYSLDFYNKYGLWIFDPNGTCNKWLNKLFKQNFSPNEAAEIIERCFKISFKKF